MLRNDNFTDEQNEEFDRIMRDPHEFKRWICLVMSCAPTPTLVAAAGEAIAAALFKFTVTEVDLEDEDVEQLEKRMDAAVGALATLGLTTGMLRKGAAPHHRGYDVRSFWDYAAQRAVEDSAEANAPGPSHPAEPDQHHVGGGLTG